MLVCALAFSAYADDIECPGAPVSSQPTASSWMPNGITDVLLIMLEVI
jgi:hypothetical protein